MAATAWIKLRCTMLKHHSSPIVRLFFSGAYECRGFPATARSQLGHRRRWRDFGLLSLRFVHGTALGRRNWLPDQPRGAVIVPVCRTFGGLQRCRWKPFPEGAPPWPRTARKTPISTALSAMPRSRPPTLPARCRTPPGTFTAGPATAPPALRRRHENSSAQDRRLVRESAAQHHRDPALDSRRHRARPGLAVQPHAPAAVIA